MANDAQSRLAEACLVEIEELQDEHGRVDGTPISLRDNLGRSSGSAYEQPPHQSRTRNNLNEPPQTRSNSNETAAKSTTPIDSPPLITVWLQVRVLPGPPVIQIVAITPLPRRATAPETPRFVADCRSSVPSQLMFLVRSNHGLSVPWQNRRPCRMKRQTSELQFRHRTPYQRSAGFGRSVLWKQPSLALFDFLLRLRRILRQTNYSDRYSKVTSLMSIETISMLRTGRRSGPRV